MDKLTPEERVNFLNSQNVIVEYIDDNGIIYSRSCKNVTFCENGNGEDFIRKHAECIIRGLRTGKKVICQITSNPITSVERSLFNL